MSNLNDPRVLFAAERTLLAWNRTSLGLMAFGFVVERASLLLELLRQEASSNADISSAFLLGLTFIIFGGICALVSAYQYSAVLKTLTAEEIPEGYSTRWGLVVNIVLAILSGVLSVTLYHLHT